MAKKNSNQPSEKVQKIVENYNKTANEKGKKKITMEEAAEMEQKINKIVGKDNDEYIMGTDSFTNSKVKVFKKDIRYVSCIRHIEDLTANPPVTLSSGYRVVHEGHGTVHTISENQFKELAKGLDGTKIVYSFVDIHHKRRSYSWNAKEIPTSFPTLEQIKAEDKIYDALEKNKGNFTSEDDIKD